MKKILFFIIAIFMATGFRGNVQQIDEKRMNKDLEIAKNILGTLIKSESGSFFGGEAISADYIKDYGVVFTIPEHLVYFHLGEPMIAPTIVIPDVQIAPMPEFNFEYNFENLSDEDREKVEREMEQAQEEMEKAQEQMQKVQEQMEAIREEAEAAQQEAREHAEKARAEARAARAEARVWVGNDVPPPPAPGSEIDWENLMITFLADYADLISQLKPEERIMVKQQSPGAEFGWVWEGDEEVSSRPTGLSAEVKRSDITAYKTAKISRDEFVKRVTIKKTEPQKKIADLEMFSSVLNRYFSRDLTESLVVLGKARYEKLDGFGVIYTFGVEDPSRISSRQYYIQERNDRVGRSTGTSEADNTQLVKLYAEFKQDIQDFVLDYGRTIRSVEDSEKVQLEVKLPNCSQCQMPAKLSLTVPMTVLKQYDQQKISRDKALTQIELAEK